MKTLIITLATILLSTQSFASVNLAKYEKEAQTILQLESQNHLIEAVVTSTVAAHRLASELKLDQVIERLNLSLLEKREENVVQNNSTRQSDSRIIRLAGDLFAILTETRSRTWSDYEVITSNQDEADGFPELIQAKRGELTDRLQNYLKKNEKGFVFMKAFAIKALDLAGKMTTADRSQVLNSVQKVVQRVSSISVHGELNIRSCIQTHYPQHVETYTSSRSIFGLFDVTSSQVYTKPEHTDKSCINSSETQTQGFTESILTVDIVIADLQIQASQKRLDLKMVTDVNQVYYPTWGSDHFVQ